MGLAMLLRAGERGGDPESAPPLPPDLALIPLPPERGSDPRSMAMEIFSDGVDILPTGRVVQLDIFMRRQQRTLVQKLIQLAEDHFEQLLGLTALRDPQLPRAAHNVSVCVMSLAIGRMLDLCREHMARLGLAALNHNIGETLLPQDLFTPGKPLNPQERELVNQHPLMGTRYVLQHYGFSEGLVERALISTEHHQWYDGTKGYPLAGARARHLFTRIISICDGFQTLCCMRTGGKSYTPETALQIIAQLAGTQFDPVLVRVLIRGLGVYPPGTLVELSTGEWAIVVGKGEGRSPAFRPRVLLISDPNGEALDPPRVVDLGELDPVSMSHRRFIEKTRDAIEFEVAVASLLVGERIVEAPDLLDSGAPAVIPS